jgi:hypothetical protein
MPSVDSVTVHADPDGKAMTLLTVQYAEHIGKGIDLTRPNETDKCPWCEGYYAAGRPEPTPEDPRPTGLLIRHTQPSCVRFVTHAMKYLADVKRHQGAGYRAPRIGERNDAPDERKL